MNSEVIIENLWAICGESPTIDEIPYWETINRYLKKIEPSKLQEIIWQLCRRLIRSRAFTQAKIRGKYWQVMIDGTQLYHTKEELDEKCPFRIHNKGTAEEYRENYCYVVEAKLVLHSGILVSILTESVENEGKEENEKQDGERKVCFRLMERLKKEFPRLPLCLSADSLYACERFFWECREKNWHFLLRFKENSIPYVWDEYKSLRKKEKNYQAMKNHYYLIQIGHRIAQVMECCAGIWKQVKQSREQKHRRILESFKKERIKEFLSLPERKVQMRLI